MQKAHQPHQSHGHHTPASQERPGDPTTEEGHFNIQFSCTKGTVSCVEIGVSCIIIVIIIISLVNLDTILNKPAAHAETGTAGQEAVQPI
jgi:hypothetical protein